MKSSPPSANHPFSALWRHRQAQRGICVLIAIAALPTGLLGQQLPPQLQPLADKEKADIAALAAAREAALKRAAQSYLAALEKVENTALAASQLNAVSAITKERDAVKSAALAGEPPPDLPKSLAAARKAYLDAVGKINAEVPARREKIDIEYLRALSALNKNASDDLAAAIEAEKKRVLAVRQLVAADVSATRPSAAIEIVPYVRDSTVKFAPSDPRTPDELSAAVSMGDHQILFSGEKKTESALVNGALVAHYGKAAFVPLHTPASGNIFAKEAAVENGTEFGIGFALKNGDLTKCERLVLAKNGNYTWSVVSEGPNTVFEVSHEGKKITSINAPTMDVASIMFCATARFRGNKADFTVTIAPE